MTGFYEIDRVYDSGAASGIRKIKALVTKGRNSRLVNSRNLFPAMESGTL